MNIVSVGVIAALSSGFLASGPAGAQSQPDAGREELVVIGVAPLSGSSIDRDKFPAETEILSAGDITREGQASVIRAIDHTLGGVNLNDNLNDPFQPDIRYHGFTASPVLGTSEGLAVYQNGVRINEAFGDNVNWDLFPDIAINRLTILGSDPVFGLNALGGAINIEMKTGFTAEGAQAEISGGSFGQRNMSFQYGRRSGDWAIYAAGRLLEEDGWRELSADSVQQAYFDAATRGGDDYTFDISATAANNRLRGQGPTPVQELAVSRSLVFTGPQTVHNQLGFLTINGADDLNDALTVHANLYGRHLRQTVLNGNTTNDAACASGGGLCNGDGSPAIGAGGGRIPDISDAGATSIGENDRNATRTTSFGGSLQVTDTNSVFGHGNHLVAGLSFDRAATDYQAVAQIGVITPQLVVAASGLFVNEPDTANGPVSLRTGNDYYGLYATDTFDVTPDFAVTVSGRYNIARLRLTDQLGTALNGDARYTRFNPAIGATYKVGLDTTVYGGLSESNRAPTAGELACSNPARPCVLPVFLSSDPPNLKQVVAHTVEAGIRGRFAAPESADGMFDWKLGLYRTDLDDDIVAVTTPLNINTGYYQNAGKSRRQGLDASLDYRDPSWSFHASYSLVDATFRSAINLSSASPAANANGTIQVRSGDRLPGIPEHRLKLAADYNVTAAWAIGGTLGYFSGQYYANDQSNQERPLPGDFVVNLNMNYTVGDHLEVFGEFNNALDARYGTYAIFGDPAGVGAPGVPEKGGRANRRFISPAPPLGVVGGVRIKF